MTRAIFQEQVFPIRHKLYRFALRITGSVHEAEDVVQEVMEKIWKTLPEQSEKVDNWEAWCMTLTRNRSLDKTRSRGIRRSAPLDSIQEPTSQSHSPAQALESSDLIARIRCMMQQLPDKQRLVMHLRDIEELTYDEIAQALDISLEQVKVNLHRARKSMRAKMLGDEKQHTHTH